MLEIAAERVPGGRVPRRATRSSCRSRTARSTGCSPATSTATSRRTSGCGSWPRRGASRASSSSSTRRCSDGVEAGMAGARPERRLALGGATSATSRGGARRGARRRRDAASTGTGSSSCARALDAPPLVVPLARLAPARQPPVPRVRRGRLPARVAAGRRGAAGQEAFILGQAPGIVEAEERRPWRGRAGQTLRRWLDMDEDAFYATFYCASVTRCYPGPGARRRRRPDADRARAGALLVLARLGARAAAARG